MSQKCHAAPEEIGAQQNLFRCYEERIVEVPEIEVKAELGAPPFSETRDSAFQGYLNAGIFTF